MIFLQPVFTIRILRLSNLIKKNVTLTDTSTKTYKYLNFVSVIGYWSVYKLGTSHNRYVEIIDSVLDFDLILIIVFFIHPVIEVN